MLPRPHRIRRGRRTDFVAVMEILASSNLPTPPPDRATLRRFRNIVADLGSDLYVATIDERPVGIVHVSYARQIATYPVARIELLVVAPDTRHQGVGTSLVRHMEARARTHACVRMSCEVGTIPQSLAAGGIAFFMQLGWTLTGVTLSITL